MMSRIISYHFPREKTSFAVLGMKKGPAEAAGQMKKKEDMDLGHLKGARPVV